MVSDQGGSLFIVDSKLGLVTVEHAQLVYFNVVHGVLVEHFLLVIFQRRKLSLEEVPSWMDYQNKIPYSLTLL